MTNIPFSFIEVDNICNKSTYVCLQKMNVCVCSNHIWINFKRKVSFMFINSPSVSEEGSSGLLFPLKYWARQLWCPGAARGTQVLHIFQFLPKLYTSGNWLIRKITIHQNCFSMCLAMYTQRDLKKNKCHTEKGIQVFSKQWKSRRCTLLRTWAWSFVQSIGLIWSSGTDSWHCISQCNVLARPQFTIQITFIICKKKN